MRLGKDFFLWFAFVQGLVELFIKIFGDTTEPEEKTKS